MFDIYAYELLATVETDPSKRVLISIFTESPDLTRDDAVTIVSRTHPYILNCVRIQGLRKSEEPIPKQFASRNALPNGVIYYQKL